MLLLCIIFAMNPELADGTLSGKICWFHFTSLLLAGGVLLMEFTTKKSRFIFSLPDALLLLLFGIVLVSYDKDENLQPERFLFIAQLVALWFMLRGALQAHQELRPFFITIIIFTGIVPAIWGISHTINPAPITHPVFRLLETSLKPEPFYGYIAVIFPVCLNTLLRFKNCDKIALWKSRTFLFYFSILGSTLIITTLIFKTDQPVWLAALLSGIWVCWMRLIGWKQTKEAIQNHIQLFAISSIILFVAITAVILVGNIQKAQAGDRRLLIWNITTQAIMEHPVTGIGIGGFPATYAKEQSAYFETDTASSKEKQTATCPQYAYNEYLQIGLELGITGLLFFIFRYAFEPQAIVGGGFGYAIKLAISQGAKRGLFSNEAGMGSTPHAHALANVKNPHEQGTVAIIGVFIDMFVILTLNALVIISTLYAGDGPLAGCGAAALSSTFNKTNLAQCAFGTVFGYKAGSMFVAICLFFFAFSTILSWNLFGKINMVYLFGKKSANVYTLLALIFIFLGTTMSNDLVWELSDMLNQLMVIPNAIALLALTSHVVKHSHTPDRLSGRENG